MTDYLNHDRFLAEFEAATLPNEAFHHRDHVRMAWIYLERHDPVSALARFTSGLRHYATATGHPDLYHATITWAFLLLIEERRAVAKPSETWDEFAARNPDLFAWKPSILDRYYRPETLASPRAKAGFVLPDRLEASR